MKDLITVQKITLNKSIIWKRKAYKRITWDRFFDNEIVEDILHYTKKKNERMNQFLIERICQKIDPFQSPRKKNKFK